MDATPTGPPIPFLKKHALTFKLAWVLFLVLVLLIPLAMIRSLLRERMGRRNQAVADITSSWGREQTVVGPVLVIPYQYKVKTWKEQTVNGKLERIEVEDARVANAFFLPDELLIDGAVTPTKLHRGIYDAVVYKGTLDLSGRFPPPDFAELGIQEDSVQWESAVVTLAVSDLRGTGNVLAITMGGQTSEFAPGCRLNGYPSGITARVPAVQELRADLTFRMTLDVKGSGGMSFAPVGRRNRVKLTSTWPDPSFRGAFLPAERKVSSEGFDASWEVSWYGRGYSQQSTDQAKDRAFAADAINPSLFGVDFLALVDAYRMVERSAKHGALFIALIFAAFFLFEALSALRIHTIQYTLVGAALCLFYLAVLSL
ncbi:MAG: cell envelope integrity protein CreD, partial [Planctomycetota bacterium]